MASDELGQLDPIPQPGSRTPESTGLATIVADWLLTGFMAALAALTLVTHAAQAFGASFRTYTALAVLVVLSLIGAGVVVCSRRVRRVQRTDLAIPALLLIIGVACGIVALAANRSDADDYYYTPNVVHALEYSSEPMGFDINFLDGGPACQIASHSWGTALPYEYTQGVVARAFGVDFLTVYYQVFPAIVAFLIPLATYSLLARFAREPVQILVGTVLTIGIVLLLGETHRTYGNFFLTRAFQGKTLLLAVGIPFFSAMSLKFLRSPSRSSWLVLATTATALVGATASAIPILGALGLTLAIAHGLSVDRSQRSAVWYLLYLSTLSYVAANALVLLLVTTIDLGPDSPVNRGFPTSFVDQFGLIVDSQRPFTLVAFAVFGALAVLLSDRVQRRFLIAWFGATTVLFFNPLVAPIVIEYLTSPNIYWRLFYVYPFPLVVGITAVHAVRHAQAMRPQFRVGAMVLVATLLLGMHFVPGSPSSLKDVDFHWPPTYKLPSDILAVSRSIDERAPAGTMLAPPTLSGVIPMLGADHPQVRIRTAGVLVWLDECGKSREAQLRLGASAFVGGDLDRFDEFVAFLETEGRVVRSIVLRASLLTMADVESALTTHAFTTREIVGSFAVVSR